MDYTGTGAQTEDLFSAAGEIDYGGHNCDSMNRGGGYYLHDGFIPFYPTEQVYIGAEILAPSTLYNPPECSYDEMYFVASADPNEPSEGVCQQLAPRRGRKPGTKTTRQSRNANILGGESACAPTPSSSLPLPPPPPPPPSLIPLDESATECTRGSLSTNNCTQTTVISEPAGTCKPNHKREQNEYAETHSGLASGSTFALGDCLSTDSLSQIFLGNACETQLRTPLEPSTISDPQFSTPKRSSNRPPLETSPNYYSKVLSPSSKFLDFLSFDSDSFSGKYNSPLQLRQDLLSQILPSVTTTIPLSTAPVEVKEQRDSFAQSSNTLSSTASTQPVTALPLSAQHNQKCGYPESLEPQAKVVDSEELYVPKIAELTSCPSLIVASSPPELQPAEFNAQSPIHELSALTAPPNLHRKRQGNSRLPKAITDKRPRKGSVDTTSKTQVLPQNILATVPAKGRGWSEVADEIVAEAHAEEHDQNIRRRIYDVLNVLKALKVIIKTSSKEISWAGLPDSNFSLEAQGFKLEKAQTESRIQKKIDELTVLRNQYRAYSTLADRNKSQCQQLEQAGQQQTTPTQSQQPEPSHTPSAEPPTIKHEPLSEQHSNQPVQPQEEGRVYVPFCVLSTSTTASIKWEFSPTKTRLDLVLSQPYQLMTDNQLLDQLNP